MRTLLTAAAVLAAAGTCAAQPKEPIGRFVADVRVASTGMPGAAGWTPVVPEGTEVPTRAIGIEAGAHVYVLRFRRIALGVGGTFLAARRTTAPPAADGNAPPPPAAIPEVSTRLTSMTPQLSLNFGHSLGWSYLSAGLGRTKVESDAALTGSGAVTFTPRQSDWTKTLNYGGGARWFINRHVGVGFDVRWHKVSLIPPSARHPGAPRASLLTAGAGIVLK